MYPELATVLTNVNYKFGTSFRGQIYRQIFGAAMGSPDSAIVFYGMAGI